MPSHGQKYPMNQGLFILPSYCPSVLLSGSFLGIGSLFFFLKLSMVLGAHVLLCMTELDFWTPGCGWKGPMNQNLSVLWSSVLPSFCLEVFLGLAHFFSETQHGVRGHVVCDRARFFEKNLFAQKIGKLAKNWQKKGFLNLLENLVIINCFLYLVCNESLYYMLYSCTNHIFGKNLIPEIWTKMLLANQITGFLNQLHLQSKIMKKPNFLHVDTD